MEPYLRIMRGDLKELYEREVLGAPDGEAMMYVINIMCGNDENLWTKLMSNDEVSFAFESCYDSYPVKISDIQSSYHCCDFPSKMKL